MPGTTPEVIAILVGAVSVLVAFFAIVRPGLAAATLTWFLGVWLLARGVLEIVEGFNARESDRRWTLVLVGVVDGAIGGLFMADPGEAVLGIAFFLGLLVVVWGLALVGLAFFVRRAAPDIRTELSDPAYG